MKVLKIRKFTEVLVELENGKEYKDEDLESGFVPQLQEIKADSLRRIAYELGFDGWSWSGHEKDGKTEVKFYMEAK